MYCVLLFSASNKVIKSCEGSRKYGSNVFIDFYEISRPCTCNVLPSFDGQLLIKSGEIAHNCGTQIDVTNAKTVFRYICPIPFISEVLNVNINQLVDVRAVYLSPSIKGIFYHCLGFQQNGMNVYVWIHNLAQLVVVFLCQSLMNYILFITT